MTGIGTLIRSTARNLNTTGNLSLLRRLTSTSVAASPPTSFHTFSSCLSSSRLRLFPPLLGHAGGPLFLTSPAWKLSQSSTPILVHGKVETFQVKGGGAQLMKPVVLWETGKGVRNGADEVEDSVWNLPNLISISRMVSGPVIGWMIINGWYSTSFLSLAISGMTDWLDGFVARRMNINSVFGSYLDPLADKVLIGCVALAMVKKDLLHPGLVVLVVVRDVGLIGGAIYMRASILGWQWRSWSDFVSLNTTRPEKVEPLFISKVNTVFQLILVAAALLQPDFGSEDSQWYITCLSWLVASTTVASSVAYGAKHLHRLPV